VITLDQIEVGDALPELTVAISRADLVRYAGASGDFNPIHWNERFAKEVGLPDVIAHGMFTMAEAGRLLTDWAGDPGAVVEYGARFTRPVVVPDPAGTTLVVNGKVTSKSEDGRVGVGLSATVDGQTVLARARAVLRLPTGTGKALTAEGRAWAG
jgi:acyl dehydratase